MYNYGDKVNFSIEDGKVLQGEIYIIDKHGTFEKPGIPSYDIMTDDCLYKHVTENLIYGKVGEKINN
jgi:hypothetical protein